MNVRLLRVAVAALLGLLALTGCTSNPSDHYVFDGATTVGQLIPVADRKPAPDISAEKLDGDGDYPVTKHAEKIVVVNFWATWCPPCVVETPQFDSIYRAQKDDGVIFVGVDMKNYPRSAAQSFVADKKISYPIVYDEKGEVALQLGNLPTNGLPFTVLIDRQGRVAALYIEALTQKDLEPALQSLRAET